MAITDCVDVAAALIMRIRLVQKRKSILYTAATSQRRVFIQHFVHFRGIVSGFQGFCCSSQFNVHLTLHLAIEAFLVDIGISVAMDTLGHRISSGFVTLQLDGEACVSFIVGHIGGFGTGDGGRKCVQLLLQGAYLGLAIVGIEDEGACGLVGIDGSLCALDGSDDSGQLLGELILYGLVHGGQSLSFCGLLLTYCRDGGTQLVVNAVYFCLVVQGNQLGLGCGHFLLKCDERGMTCFGVFRILDFQYSRGISLNRLLILLDGICVKCRSSRFEVNLDGAPHLHKCIVLLLVYISVGSSNLAFSVCAGGQQGFLVAHSCT